MNHTLWRIDAAGAADGAGFSIAPASALVTTAPPPGTASPWSCRLLALAHPAEIDRLPAAAEVPPDRRLSLPESVLTPALVNAHTHLDLTHVGPRPYDASGGFVGWAMSLVRPSRAATWDAALASLQDGIRRSLAGGVVAVGDIIAAVAGCAGKNDARVLLARELRAALGEGGVGFAEVFGWGASESRAINEMTTLASAGCDLQPHAPYSVAPAAFRHAAKIGTTASTGDAAGHRLETGATAVPRLCTHLAETLDERRFIQQGDGPFRGLLERIGLWDDNAAREIGRGRHPIEHTLATGMRGFLAAHVNDCPPQLIEQLRSAEVSIAYCPRAHAYFHHPTTTGPHRYREMLEAGVNVCLGTDSIINLPESQSDRISPLDDARLLFQRDRVDPGVLLKMMTTNGARALGLNGACFAFGTGERELAGLVAVDVSGTDAEALPANRIMQSRGAAKLLRLSRSHRTEPA